MKRRTRDDREGRASVREVFERATRVPRPDTDSLLARVPVVLAAASRARRPRREDAFSAMVPMAARVLPRLAAVAALFAVLAVGLHWSDDTAQTTASSPSLEGLILTGDESAIADDFVLETILENGNG